MRILMSLLTVLSLLLTSPAQADALYASYAGSQLGMTIRDVNTLNQYIWLDSNVSASGLTVNEQNEIYLSSGNVLLKYSLSGEGLARMTFPDAGIAYTDVAVSGKRLYASYSGTQLGVTIRDGDTLEQIRYFATGIEASAIAVDGKEGIYLAAGNRLHKYDSQGKLLVEMVFPDATIRYTGLAVRDGLLYASYTGSQLGISVREASSLKQLSYFATGVEASGLAVDSRGDLYLSADNRLRKYQRNGTLLNEMIFPDAGIRYTGVSVR